MIGAVSGQDLFGLVGKVLDGQFRVDAVVGEGGFSVVYRGRHLGLEEPIAIKCLKLPPAIGPQLVDSFTRRFRDESRIQYRLSQGNLHIARTMASGTTMSSISGALVPYMVLEWLEGRSLATDLDNRRLRGLRGRNLDDAVRLLDPAADGLAYAHAQGVIHRDLNPGNIFIMSGGTTPRVKVLDFGVAKVVSDHAMELGPRAATIGQMRIFAPAYGSPEQFDEQLGAVGPHSDVYSFAQILVEMLRDKPTVEGEHLGKLAAQTVSPDRRPTPQYFGLSQGPEVDAVFARALTLRPADRWRDMGEFWGAMKNALRVSKEQVQFAAAKNSLPLAYAEEHGGDAVTAISSSQELQALVAKAKHAPAAKLEVAVPTTPLGAPAGGIGASVERTRRALEDDLPNVAAIESDEDDGPTIAAPSSFAMEAAAPVAPQAEPATVAVPRPARQAPRPAAGAKPISATLASTDLEALAPPAQTEVDDDSSEEPTMHVGAGDVESFGSDGDDGDDEDDDDEPQRTLALAPDHPLQPAPSYAPETPILHSADSPLQVTLARDNPPGFMQARTLGFGSQAFPDDLRPPPNLKPTTEPTGFTPAGQQLQRTLGMGQQGMAHAALAAQGQAMGQALNMQSANMQPAHVQPANMQVANMPGSALMADFAGPFGPHGPAPGVPAFPDAMGMAGPSFPDPNVYGQSGAQQALQPPMQPMHGGMQGFPDAFGPGGNAPFGAPPLAYPQGGFSPNGVAAPTAPVAPQVDAPQGDASKKNLLMAVGVVVGLVVFGGLLFVLYSVFAQRTPAPPPAVTSAATAPPLTTTAEPPVLAPPVVTPPAAAQMTADPEPTSEPPAASVSASASTPTAAPTPSAPPAPSAAPMPNSVTPPPNSARPQPSASSTASAPTPSSKPSASAAPSDGSFDPNAARAAVSRSAGAITMCKNDGGVTGPGAATVSFTTEGTVAGVALDPPYEGTKEGTCIKQLISRAKMAPYTGAFGRIRYTFNIPK
jgi:serine/threonine protein kinase